MEQNKNKQQLQNKNKNKNRYLQKQEEKQGKVVRVEEEQPLELTAVRDIDDSVTTVTPPDVEETDPVQQLLAVQSAEEAKEAADVQRLEMQQVAPGIVSSILRTRAAAAGTTFSVGGGVNAILESRRTGVKNAARTPSQVLAARRTDPRLG
jgi:hypothetical protein